MAKSAAKPAATPATPSAVPLKGIHHVEFYVGNAKQASYYYRKAFGFSQIAYSGPETGNREHASYMLAQNKVRFLITGAMQPESAITQWLAKHGDGVRDIAFEVDDVDAVFKETVKRGATAVTEPHDWADKHGKVRHAAIATYGDTIHSFVCKKDYKGELLPGFEKNEIKEQGVGLHIVDHCVGNVEEGKMDYWRDWYQNVLGFHQFLSFDDKDISTEFSALRSKVMSSDNGKIKFPINEPAKGRKKSQIQEFLDFNNHQPGVQHVALLSDDVIKTITQLRANGVDFLPTPASYYETVLDRVGKIDEKLENLKPLGILIDRDEQGYLLQLFTRPLEDRPLLFFEIIQRKGCQSFGKGNFKALFESIEREQAKRGNL